MRRVGRGGLLRRMCLGGDWPGDRTGFGRRGGAGRRPCRARRRRLSDKLPGATGVLREGGVRTNGRGRPWRAWCGGGVPLSDKSAGGAGKSRPCRFRTNARGGRRPGAAGGAARVSDKSAGGGRHPRPCRFRTHAGGGRRPGAAGGAARFSDKSAGRGGKAPGRRTRAGRCPARRCSAVAGRGSARRGMVKGRSARGIAGPDQGYGNNMATSAEREANCADHAELDDPGPSVSEWNI
jgi:hypothetical protein